MTDAATAPAAARAKLGFGRVIQGTFGVIKRNISGFLILTLVLVGAPWAVIVAGALQMGGGEFGPGSGVFGLGYLILIVTSAILQGGLIHATVADLNGRKATASECLQTGLRHFLPVTLITILAILGVVFASLLLIVPGIMIGMAWLVVVPSQVVERTGVFAAFSRSGQLTKHNRWRIFGLMVLWSIVSSVIQQTLTQLALMGAPAAAASPASFTGFGPVVWAVLGISAVLSAIVTPVGMAVIYYELRRVKEGVGPEALASVFD